MTFIRGIFDRFLLVTGIVAAGCIPSFIAQYRQRIGGRFDQVMQDIAPFQEIANKFHHGSLQELIQHHFDSVDTTFRNEGAALQAMLDSAELLKKAVHALDADLAHQFIYLLTNADPVIAHSTWKIYSPAFNLTMESIVFASVIGVLVWLVVMAIWIVLARLINILFAR